MKLKEIFYGIGLKPKLKEFTYDFRTFSTPGFPEISFAQWQHPGALRWNTQITEPRLNQLRKIIKEGDLVIDIGAHGGDYTLPFALAAGKTGLVIAFEPNPYSFKVLAANAGLNPKLTNIHPYMLAATAEDGEYTFNYSDAGFNNGGLHEGISRWKHTHFFELKVKGVNLAQFLESNYARELSSLRYIKMDTEGNDENILRSIEPLIRKLSPVFRTEFYKHTPDADRKRYLAYIRSLGYKPCLVESEENLFGPEVEDSETNKWPHFDVIALPPGFTPNT